MNFVENCNWKNGGLFIVIVRLLFVVFGVEDFGVEFLEGFWFFLELI